MVGILKCLACLTDAGAAVAAEHVSGVADALEAALRVGALSVVADGAVATLVQVGAERAVRRVSVAALTLTPKRARHVHTPTVQADARVLVTLVHVCG